MKDHSKKPSRRGKLLGGALIGAVLSIGAVAGSASAAPGHSSSASATGVTRSAPGQQIAARSGIRW